MVRDWGTGESGGRETVCEDSGVMDVGDIVGCGWWCDGGGDGESGSGSEYLFRVCNVDLESRKRRNI